jgi:hypothetical protein
MSDDKKNTGISFFEKYLTVWVALCMVAGILIGKFLPAIPAFLGNAGICEGLDSRGGADLDHDLSDDDEGRFQECEACG